MLALCIVLLNLSSLTVLVSCLCWLSTLLYSPLTPCLCCYPVHINRVYCDVRPLLSVVLSCVVGCLYFDVHTRPVSLCYTPVDGRCMHCDAHPSSLSINAAILIGIPQLYIRVSFKIDFISFPHLLIHMFTLLIISIYVIFRFYIQTNSFLPWSIFFLISPPLSSF